MKDSNTALQASALFSGSGVQIVADGHRYLGSAVGTASFIDKYVKEKVSKWIDVTELSKYALEEPQVALSAYTKGLCHRWAFIQRTTPGISSLFSPLEECIREIFIPAVIGRKVSDLERRIISLPVRHGGLGISNPVETCEREHHASKLVTNDLSDLIYRQVSDKKNKENHLRSSYQEVLQQIEDPAIKRALTLSSEKGSGSWLTVLPLKEFGYCLNKQEFRDALCLRYGWNIPKTPTLLTTH